MKTALILLIIFIFPAAILANREHPEKWYQEEWCEAHKGQVEAVGQSAYYSLQTNKKPGIVLILETIKDRKYWIRLNTTIEHFNLPIDTWNVGNASY
jgi:hypothetical protein